MRLADLLPERLHGVTKELAKFGTIGVINLVVNFAVANVLLLTVLRGGEVKAKAVAAIVATTCAYFMNRHWTYRDRPKSTLRREYSLFILFNAVGFVIETGIVAFTKYGLHETHILAFNISTAIGIGLGTLFRFWAYRTHVFKAGEPDNVPVQFAAALAEIPPVHDEPEVTTPARAPKVVVTSATPGSIVIKVLDADQAVAEELDEIELDGMVAMADEPARATS